MTRPDQELLDMQFSWLQDSRRAEVLLAISLLSAILLCILLGSATIA